MTRISDSKKLRNVLAAPNRQRGVPGRVRAMIILLQLSHAGIALAPNLAPLGLFRFKFSFSPHVFFHFGSQIRYYCANISSYRHWI